MTHPLKRSSQSICFKYYDIQSYSKILPGTVLNNNLSPSYLQTFIIDLLLKNRQKFFFCIQEKFK